MLLDYEARLEGQAAILYGRCVDRLPTPGLLGTRPELRLGRDLLRLDADPLARRDGPAAPRYRGLELRVGPLWSLLAAGDLLRVALDEHQRVALGLQRGTAWQALLGEPPQAWAPRLDPAPHGLAEPARLEHLSLHRDFDREQLAAVAAALAARVPVTLLAW